MTQDRIPDVASVTGHSRRRDWRFRLGLGLSLAIHGGVAATLLTRAPSDFGATDLVTTAISVNIVATEIVQAAEQSQTTQAAPASARSPPLEVASPGKAEIDPPRQEPQPQAAGPPPELATEAEPPKEDAAEQASEAAREAEARDRARRLADDEARAVREAEARERAEAEARTAREAEARDKARQLAEDEARAARDAEARDKARQLAEDQAREARDKERQLTEDRARAAREADAEAERERRDGKAERQAREKRARKVASAGTSGANGARSSTGQVSASQGALQTYQGIVNAWMARNKPAFDGKTGVVVIVIALSPSGALISAHVHSSSGNQALDQLALAAARKSSPFPKPPAGATAKQLLFSFPYKFR